MATTGEEASGRPPITCVFAGFRNVEGTVSREPIGRGVPKEWITGGAVIELCNYPIADNRRMGMKIEVADAHTVKLTLTGDVPEGPVVFNLPIFLNGNVASTSAGSIEEAEGTSVVLPRGTRGVSVSMGAPVAANSRKPIRAPHVSSFAIVNTLTRGPAVMERDGNVWYTIQGRRVRGVYSSSRGLLILKKHGAYFRQGG